MIDDDRIILNCYVLCGLIYLGDMKEKKRYFFSNIRNESAIANDGKCKIAAGSGYWKPVGKNRQILASGTKQVVGIRKTLIFCEGKRGHETKTQWVMHQYHLVAIATNTNLTQPVSPFFFFWENLCDHIVIKSRLYPRKRGFEPHISYIYSRDFDN